MARHTARDVQVLILSAPVVHELLPMAECMEVVADALRALARGEALNPLRWAVSLPRAEALLGLMPGALPGPAPFGLKAVSVFPHNRGTGYDSHQGVVVLFEPEHGAPVGLVDASAITEIRTAAASALATRLLARAEATELGILGSGVQARAHLEAMFLVRRIRGVRVFSPDAEQRRAFAEREARRHGVRVEAVATARDAVRGADIVCTVTSSREPVLRGEFLADGTHVNAVGACVPSARELDTAAVVRSRVFVDRRESALSEAGDLMLPIREGAIGEDHIVGELGELLLGRVEGRRASAEVTLFKSLGLAVEDLAAAERVLATARARGAGTRVEIGPG
jgi:ornithine cyclodeaminase